MKRTYHLFTAIIILVCFYIFEVNAQVIEAANSHSSKSNNQSVNNHLQSIKSTYPKMDQIRDWKINSGKFSDWSVTFNSATGTPHRAFGKAVKIKGFDKITNQNIEKAALKFINDNARILKVNPSCLKLKRITEVNGRWYVSYVQVHNGMEVLLSEIELRIFSNGNVVAFGSDYYGDIEIPSKKIISMNEAGRHAAKGLDFKKDKDEIQGSNKLFIYPLLTSNGHEYKLVYRFDVRTYDTPGNYVSYVDAHNGDIAWRHNRVSNIKSKIDIKGSIKQKTPQDSLTTVPFSNIAVNLDNKIYYTDSDGVLDIDITDTAQISSALEGKWIKIDIQDSADALFEEQIAPGEDISINWTDSDSYLAARNLYYHGNLAHKYIKDLDSNFTGMDYQVNVKINFGDTGEDSWAFWDGQEINFNKVADKQRKYAETSYTTYHEYGHGVNQKLYEQLDSEDGMINLACNEGMADVFASAIMDDNELGKGELISDPERIAINLKNRRIYPDSLLGEEHLDGMILSGAFWDLRELTSLEYYRYISHYVKYGLPDDIVQGVAFSEWFLETLIADDDDGDLSNGTPHSDEIVTAFNNHQIGSNLMLRASFAHEPLLDTRNTKNPYLVEFSLQGLPLDDYKADSVIVVYSVDNFTSSHVLMAYEHETGIYRAEIPAQQTGTIVSYYMKAIDQISKISMKLAGNHFEEFEPYSFAVDYNTIHTDDLEESGSWSVGDTYDNATVNTWELVDPNQINFYDLIIQPGADHSENGSKCFITGGQKSNFFGFTPNGRTSLISPVFNLSGIEKPVMKYYLWLFYSSLLNQPGSTWGLQVHVSNDAGDTWRRVEIIKSSTFGWNVKYLKVEDYFENPGQFRIKFVVYVVKLGNYLSAYVDALIDDFEILSLDDLTLSTNNMKADPEIKLHTYPNPSAGKVFISYKIDEPGPVKLVVNNSLGKEEVGLINDLQTPGERTVTWDGIDRNGHRLVPGVYFLTLSLQDRVISKKVVLY